MFVATIAILCGCIGRLYGQAEHYDVNPRFSYGPTAVERQMLPTHYRQVRTTTPPTAPVTALAEFDPMAGVLIAYPLGIPVSLVRELSMITNVKVLVYPASDSNTVKTYFQSSGVNMENVGFWVVDHDSYWTRDYGPWFVVDGNDQVGVVDFTYNRPQRVHDDAAMEIIATCMGMTRYEMPMVHTGGNYMVDGYGTVASTSLILEENPAETAASLTQMASDYLGTSSYMITNDPLGEYIAHIDCWGKFLAPNKVLIAQVPANHPRYSEYEITANLFSNAYAYDSSGEQMQVYRVYEPGSNSAVTPYTNSLIINDHVFVPVTGTQWDEAALNVYRTAMPGYTVTPIMQSNYTPWMNTDALHCRTHELADKEMLFVRHTPLYGQQTFGADCEITATIKSLGGHALVQDSLLIWYRQGGGAWQSQVLQPQGAGTYHTYLTDLAPETEVDYYLTAQDVTGRKVCHPFTGAADPHHFTMTSVGVEIQEKPTIEVFPNPAVDCFVVRGENMRCLMVYDQTGKLRLQENTIPNIHRVDIDRWPAGVYFISVTDHNLNVITKKVVKVR